MVGGIMSALDAAVDAVDVARDAPPLLALLERAFAGDEPKGPASHGVSNALWERALLGPLRAFLSRPGKELRARLVESGFVLAGGTPRAMPPELPLLIEILHAGSLIVDDIEDDSEQRRGLPALHRVHGLPVALNAANWLYFWPQHLLSRMALPARARLDAHERIAESLLRCHEGQALDLTVRLRELARGEVPQVVRVLATLKTGKLVGLATALGAIAALAPARRVEVLARFGCEIGVGLQMLDDLSGVVNPSRRDKALEDLRLDRATWLWAWLAEDEESYAELRAQLSEVQLSSDCGAYDGLLSELRFRLGMTGVRRVRRHFDAAVVGLERAMCCGALLGEVRAELASLEHQFLGTT